MGLGTLVSCLPCCLGLSSLAHSRLEFCGGRKVTTLTSLPLAGACSEMCYKLSLKVPRSSGPGHPEVTCSAACTGWTPSLPVCPPSVPPPAIPKGASWDYTPGKPHAFSPWSQDELLVTHPTQLHICHSQWDKVRVINSAPVVTLEDGVEC